VDVAGEDEVRVSENSGFGFSRRVVDGEDAMRTHAEGEPLVHVNALSADPLEVVVTDDQVLLSVQVVPDGPGHLDVASSDNKISKVEYRVFRGDHGIPRLDLVIGREVGVCDYPPEDRRSWHATFS
jgi:hypothetical protein